MKVNEIFTSIDGEVNKWGQGTLSTFVRFQGCNLACSYCDTQYASDKSWGRSVSPDEIFDAVHGVGCRKVTITGGEPLLQPRSELVSLIMEMVRCSYKISMETNGSVLPPMALSRLEELNFVFDYKLPSSGMEGEMHAEVFPFMREDDYIKFVVRDRVDYMRAVEVLKTKYVRGRVAFSPVYGILSAKQLMQWLISDRLFNVQLNLQLHRVVDVK